MSFKPSPNVTLRRRALHPPLPLVSNFRDQQQKLLVDILNGNERVGIFCVFQEGQEEMALELANSLRMAIVKDPYSPAYLVTIDGSLGLLYRQSFLKAVLRSPPLHPRQSCMQVIILAFQSFCRKIRISLIGATKLILQSYRIFTPLFVGILYSFSIISSFLKAARLLLVHYSVYLTFTFFLPFSQAFNILVCVQVLVRFFLRGLLVGISSGFHRIFTVLSIILHFVLLIVTSFLLRLTLSCLSFIFHLLYSVLHTVFCMGVALLVVLVVLAPSELYLSLLSEQTYSCICLQ